MAGTIVTDRIESDASYASRINVASQIQFSNTITGNVNVNSGGLFVDSVNTRVGVGTQNPSTMFEVYGSGTYNVLSVASAATKAAYARFNNTTNYSYFGVDDSTGSAFVGVANSTNIWNSGSYPIILSTNATEKMRIDATGRVTMPYQPAFGAYKTNGNQTTAGQITFDGTDSNTGGYFSTSTSRFTAPVAGRYFFTCSLLRLLGYSVNWYIRKNGSGVLSYVEDTQSTTQYSMSTQSTVVDLVANDYIDIYMPSAGGIYGSSRYGTFCGFLIG